MPGRGRGGVLLYSGLPVALRTLCQRPRAVLGGAGLIANGPFYVLLYNTIDVTLSLYVWPSWLRARGTCMLTQAVRADKRTSL